MNNVKCILVVLTAFVKKICLKDYTSYKAHIQPKSPNHNR